jgi:hypothetical protein
MNAADISNALLVGIPVVTCMRYGYESLMGCRGRRVLAADAPQLAFDSAPRHATTSAKLRLAVAESTVEVTAALDLVSRRYAWRGYGVGSEGNAPVVQRTAQEVTFIVDDRSKTVGTVTLGFDGAHGLLAEQTHNAVIAKFRESGRRVCELTRLAVAEAADTRAVLASLLGLAHFVGRSMHNATDVFIEVNPRHVGYYSRVLGFAVAASAQLCPRVHAPSVLLRLELDALEGRLRHSGGVDVVTPALQVLAQRLREGAPQPAGETPLERVADIGVDAVAVVVASEVAIVGTGENVHAEANPGIADGIPVEPRPDHAPRVGEVLDPQQLRLQFIGKLGRDQHRGAHTASLDRQRVLIAMDEDSLESLNVETRFTGEGKFGADHVVERRAADNVLGRSQVSQRVTAAVGIDSFTAQHHFPEILGNGGAGLGYPVEAWLESKPLRVTGIGHTVEGGLGAEGMIVKRRNVPAAHERVRANPDA